MRRFRVGKTLVAKVGGINIRFMRLPGLIREESKYFPSDGARFFAHRPLPQMPFDEFVPREVWIIQKIVRRVSLFSDKGHGYTSIKA